MKRYWLCRAPGQAAEGPFELAQIQALFARGQITADASVCEVDTTDWYHVGSELRYQRELAKPAPLPPPTVTTAVAVERGIAQRDQDLVKTWGRAADWLVVLTCLFALIPGIGLLAWGAVGIVAIIVTVLAIMTFGKGRVGKGIWMLVGAWVAMPIAVLIANIVGTGTFTDWLKQGAEAHAAATARARVAPPGEVPADLTEKFDEFKKTWVIEPESAVMLSPAITVSPWIWFADASVNRPILSLWFRRRHDDWQWLKHRELSVLVDGEGREFTSSFYSDVIGGGMVSETLNVKLTPAQWREIEVAHSARFKIGSDELTINDSVKEQMRQARERWEASGGVE